MSEIPSCRALSAKVGLGATHLDALTRAITNTLNTGIAEATYAQIVDGMPLAEVVFESQSPRPPSGHPVYEHTKLCDGVMEKLHQLRQDLERSELQFEPKLLHQFHTSAPGSRQYCVRLAEMAAVAIHQIAVKLYQLDIGLHRHDGSSTWTPPEDDFFWRIYPEGVLPTLLYHRWYENHENYPNGIADMVGYWAEERIFGGVVLFDRRHPDSSPEVDSNSVWIHPNRESLTYRICKLNDEQRRNLTLFLTSEEPSLYFLPILPGENNAIREDPEEPVQFTGIHRDPWERQPWREGEGDGRVRDVVNPLDYPTRADWERAYERAYDRQSGYPPYDEEEPAP